MQHVLAHVVQTFTLRRHLSNTVKNSKRNYALATVKSYNCLFTSSPGLKIPIKKTVCRQTLQPWPEKINIKLFTLLTNVIFGDSGESKQNLRQKGEMKSSLRSERLSSRSSAKEAKRWGKKCYFTDWSSKVKYRKQHNKVKKTIMHPKSQAGANSLLKTHNVGQTDIIACGRFIIKDL